MKYLIRIKQKSGSRGGDDGGSVGPWPVGGGKGVIKGHMRLGMVSYGNWGD